MIDISPLHLIASSKSSHLSLQKGVMRDVRSQDVCDPDLICENAGFCHFLALTVLFMQK
jgi:hypothetical protein